MKNRISMHAFLRPPYTAHVMVTEIRLYRSVSWTWTILCNGIITCMGAVYGFSLWNHYLYSSIETYALHGFTLVSLVLSCVKVIRTKRTAGSFSNLSLTSVTDSDTHWWRTFWKKRHTITTVWVHLNSL